MITSFTRAVCVLHLEHVTPIVRAFLGDYSLADHTHHNGQATFWLHPRDPVPTWNVTLPRLIAVASAHGLTHSSESIDKIDLVVKSLAHRLGCRDEALLNHAISYSLAHPIDLETLFVLLISLDDGHRLRAVSCQSSRGFDSPHPLWGGGCSWYISREVCLHGDSFDAVQLATSVSTALRDDDPDAVVRLIAKQASGLVGAIANAELKPLIALRVAQTLLKQVAAATPKS